MKKSIIFIFTTIALFLSSFSYAENYFGPYAEAKAGALILSYPRYQIDWGYERIKIKRGTKTGFFGSLALGYKFCNPFRIDGEVAYRTINFHSAYSFESKHSSSIDTWNFMGNIYYDYDLNSLIHPYIGTGIGYIHSFCAVSSEPDPSFEEFNNKGVNERNKKFAWQWMFGLYGSICRKTDILVEYRMMQNYKNNIISFGLRRFL